MFKLDKQFSSSNEDRDQMLEDLANKVLKDDEAEKWFDKKHDELFDKKTEKTKKVAKENFKEVRLSGSPKEPVSLKKKKKCEIL